MRHDRPWILAAAAVLVLVLTSPTVAIDGGTADYGAHPNVGLLAVDLDGPGGMPPFGFCTGSVISDSAFLTAAHCIYPTLYPLPPGVSWAVTMEAGTPSSPIFPGGYYPADVPACCMLTVPASAIHYPTNIVVDPLYDPATYTESTGGAHDLAVLQFAPGTFSGIKPISIVHRGMLANLGAAGNRMGPQVTVVGYGGELRNDTIYFTGYRKTGRASLVDVSGNWLELTQDTSSLPRSAALCLADSGSPAFLGGSNVVVSTMHGGGLGCRGIAYGQRLDTPAEQAFLAQFVDN